MSSRSPTGCRVTATAGVLAASGGPAAAHERSEKLFRGGALMIKLAHGGVNASHTRVWVCDERSDSLGVRIWYQLRNGHISWITDSNGAAGGCADLTPGSSSNPVKEFWITAGPTNDNPAQYSTPWYPV